MLKQPRAQEGPGPAVFVLWREMTSAFKGQAGSGREIAQSFPLLPAPASSTGAESTQGWRDDGQGLDPEAEPPPWKGAGRFASNGFLGCIRRKGGCMPPTERLPLLHQNTRTRSRRYFAASPQALLESRGDTAAEQT